MLRGIYTSASGMLVEQARQDVITNNLANIDTAGFKKDLAIFRDEPSMDMHRIDDNRKIFGKKLEIDFRPYIGRVGTGASIDEITTIHEQGLLQNTNNPTDLALFGDGMFVVETPNGIRYTRAGNFRVGSEGFLVDANGNRVMALKEPAIINKGSIITDPKGEFALNASYVPLDGSEQFKVDNDGKVYVNGEARFRLMVVNFDEPKHMKKIGYNYYEPADERAGFGRFSEGTKIEQGMLEKSNVNLVREMVNMITVMRAYESNQKAISTHDGTLGTLISRVGAR